MLKLFFGEAVDRPTSEITSGDEILDRAYQAACDELLTKYDVNHRLLAELSDRMTAALLDKYFAGQHDHLTLRRHAVATALAILQRR